MYGLSALQGETLLFLDTSKIKKNLLKLNPGISDIEIVKQYPSTIRLTVKLSSVLGYLKVDQGFYSLSKEGKVISRLKSMSNDIHPQIVYYQNFNYDDFQVSDLINQEDILTGLSFISALNEMNIDVRRLDINGPDMLVFRTSDDKEIIISNEKKLEEQVIDLKNLMIKIKVEKIDFKSIDLRFNKPVVKLK